MGDSRKGISSSFSNSTTTTGETSPSNNSKKYTSTNNVRVDDRFETAFVSNGKSKDRKSSSNILNALLQRESSGKKLVREIERYAANVAATNGRRADELQKRFPELIEKINKIDNKKEQILYKMSCSGDFKRASFVAASIQNLFPFISKDLDDDLQEFVATEFEKGCANCIDAGRAIDGKITGPLADSIVKDMVRTVLNHPETGSCSTFDRAMAAALRAMFSKPDVDAARKAFAGVLEEEHEDFGKIIHVHRPEAQKAIAAIEWSVERFMTRGLSAKQAEEAYRLIEDATSWALSRNQDWLIKDGNDALAILISNLGRA